MAAKCTVCAHPSLPDLDAALAMGHANTAVAERFGLSKDAVRRHHIAHLSPAVKAQITRRETAGARRGVDRLEELATRAGQVLEEARGKADGKLQLEALKRLESIVTTLMKVSGELDERPVVNVLNVTTDPSWINTRNVMMEALRGYPDAALAVASRLRELEP